MEIQITLGKRKRKELAKTVGNIFGAEVIYKGPPSYAFGVGPAAIGRDGNITLEAMSIKDAAVFSNLLETLTEQGYEPRPVEAEEQAPDENPDEETTTASELPAEEPETDETVPESSDEEPAEADAEPEPIVEESAEDDAEPEPVTETPTEEEPEPEPIVEESANEEPEPEAPDKLVIQMPREGFDAASLQNLRILIDNKAALIKKSLGIDALPIEVADNTVDFPWFEADVYPQDLKAYAQFITALCDMAKRQKRVMSKPQEYVENEKFTFRLFLVRLGLIGDEYSDVRKILMRNLSGNGAWKDVNGKNGNSNHPAAEKNDTPVFSDKDVVETISRVIVFVRRLYYFIQHFDD